MYSLDIQRSLEMAEGNCLVTVFVVVVLCFAAAAGHAGTTFVNKPVANIELPHRLLIFWAKYHAKYPAVGGKVYIDALDRVTNSKSSHRSC